ncbi:MAG TPA: YegS/Rv2252/BmrU family lipid kinase [Caldilineaceae bacterium]|nr:YegS/Rv2252/BmrU family lipid kinase [Caldilineaceae bacterium]
MTQDEPDVDPINAETALHTIQRRQRAQLQKVEAIQMQLADAHRELAHIEQELANAVQQEQTARPAASATEQRVVSAKRPATVILNPAAKGLVDGTHTAEEIGTVLNAVGITAVLRETTAEIDAYQLACDAVADGATLVVAAGGDGTIEEVATALIDTEVVLGILPLGTMNNVARVLGIPLALQSAVAVLAMGAIRHIDVGHVVTADHAVEGYFLETAGIGLSAVAAPMGEAYEKGRWADLFSRLGELLAGSASQVTVRCDDEIVFEAQTHTLTVSNAPLFGNNLLIAPDAKMDDGMLDLAIYADMELVDLTAYFYAIANGRRSHEPRLITRRAQHIQVTAGTPLPVNADLDLLEKQQAWEIAVKARALAVIVGNGVGLTFPVSAAPARPPLAGLQPLPAP